MTDVKAAARKAAFARRKDAHGAKAAQAGVAHLLEALMPHKGRVIAGYMPIRTEITPIPAMAAMAAWGPVVVPVIEAADQPLKFARWTPDCEMVDGAFGAAVPKVCEYLDPEVLIVPLVAFDGAGNRLGYGGGFYDRSLEGLRAKRPTLAFGYAYAAQQADGLPIEPTDQPLDAMITETGITRF
nr:5-formyltetrahydrofolate cyclo-ligase [Aliiroseovarius subalbicans]